MKSKTMFAMMFLGLVTVSVPAMARSPMPPVWNAELTRFELDEQLSQRFKVVTGSIEVDYAKREMTLVLIREMNCRPGEPCLAVMPSPFIVRLPITSVAYDRCGSKIINAMLDQRPVDGGFGALSIRDNTSTRCRFFVARPATEVVYRTESSGMGGVAVSTRSTFSGEALRPDYR